MRAAIYARVSTNKQDLYNQLEPLREYCQRQNYEVVGIYEDVVSGKAARRDGFERLFLDARQKFFDVVIFWDISRFSRSGTLHTLAKLKELENLGIAWFSYNEPYFQTTGAFRDVVLAVLACVAKMEREKISERTKAGLCRAHNVGKRGKDKHKRKNRVVEKWKNNNVALPDVERRQNDR